MNKRTPIWLWLNLLSLDAVAVGLVWLYTFSKLNKLNHVGWSSYVILGGCIWSTYVLDRVFDVVSGKDVEGIQRHQFHWKYRKCFLYTVGTVLLLCGYIALAYLPSVFLLYGLAGLILVSFYFYVASRDQAEVAYFKNTVAGFIFAYGVAMPVVASTSPLQSIDEMISFTGSNGTFSLIILLKSLFFIIMMLFAAIVHVLLNIQTLIFGAMCAINIIAIDIWERRGERSEKEQRRNNIFIGLILGVMITSYMVNVFTVSDQLRSFNYSIIVVASLFYVINRVRERISIGFLRVLADLILFVPLLVLFF